jgi:hypothetical protein
MQDLKFRPQGFLMVVAFCEGLIVLLLGEEGELHALEVIKLIAQLVTQQSCPLS